MEYCVRMHVSPAFGPVKQQKAHERLRSANKSDVPAVSCSLLQPPAVVSCSLLQPPAANTSQRFVLRGFSGSADSPWKPGKPHVWSFCRPEATLDNTWEEGISFEELPPLGWPMKMSVGHDLDY